MQGDPRIIDMLNQVLRKELTGINHHVSWIEAQQHQIREIGYENYLARQIRE
jgi:bacterioferritin (cytochrome b1)